MIDRLPRTQRNAALVVLLLLVLWFSWSIRAVLNPLLLGYMMAAIVAPLVRNLTKRGVGQRTAVVTVFAGALGAALLVGVGLVLQTRSLVMEISRPQAAPNEPAAPDVEVKDSAQSQGVVELVPPEAGVESGAEEGSDDVPASAPKSRLFAMIDRIDEVVARYVPMVEPGDVRSAIESVPADGEENGVLKAAGAAGGRFAGSLWSGLSAALESVFGLSTLVLLVPLYAFFWMFEMDAMHAWVRGHVPVRERQRTTRIASRMGEILSRFFRGRLTICLLKGLFVSAALLIAGVDYSLLLGTLAGLLSLVPFVGSAVSFALGALVASAYQDPWWVGVVIAVVVYGAAELIEGYVLMPRILGDSLGLSEVAVLFAVTAGGASLGLFGVLAALPIAAAIKVLFAEYVDPALKQWADESTPKAAGTGKRS